MRHVLLGPSGEQELFVSPEMSEAGSRGMTGKLAVF